MLISLECRRLREAWDCSLRTSNVRLDIVSQKSRTTFTCCCMPAQRLCRRTIDFILPSHVFQQPHHSTKPFPHLNTIQQSPIATLISSSNISTKSKTYLLTLFQIKTTSNGYYKCGNTNSFGTTPTSASRPEKSGPDTC